MSSISDVTALRGSVGHIFCGNSTNASVIKSVIVGEGDQKMSKIAFEVIYGRTLCIDFLQWNTVVTITATAIHV